MGSGGALGSCRKRVAIAVVDIKGQARNTDDVKEKAQIGGGLKPAYLETRGQSAAKNGGKGCCNSLALQPDMVLPFHPLAFEYLSSLTATAGVAVRLMI